MSSSVTATFVFTDLVDSTATAVGLGPEAAEVLRQTHFRLLRSAVAASGGVEVKNLGDGLMVVYASAERALAGAVGMQKAIGDHNRSDGEHLAIRVGIATGVAVEEAGDYFGDAVVTAARLCAVADGGEVFVASRTRDLVEEGDLPPQCSLVDLGLYRLKGMPVPERVFAVSGPMVSAPLSSTECPYRGLQRFDAADRELFFGREAVVAAVLGRLAPGEVLAVIGASGSGKSSLLRAGVAGGVVAGEVPGLTSVVLVTPGDGAEPLPVGEVGDLLVVDQFEELFTYCDGAERRQAFVDALLAYRGVAVIALRADFYGELTAYPALARAASDRQVLLGPMTEDELRRAVTQPAERAGLRLEPGVVDVLVRDVAGQPGALPLLSHALRATWERRNGRTLTLEGYYDSGGIESAVARSADAIVDSLDEQQRVLVRNLFVRLTELGDGGEVMRRRVRVVDAVSGSAGRGELVPILDRLAEARLVTIGDDTLEVAHEALIREWPRLREWLDEDRDGLRLHRRLGNAAQLWDAGGRDSGDLYRGARLDAADDWAQRNAVQLNVVEREFLDASRQRQGAEARELRARAAAQQRDNRRLRVLLAAVAIALVVALIGGGVAVRASNTARSQTRAANIQRLVGQSAALLNTKRDLGMLLAVEANRRADRFDTRGALESALVHDPSFLGYIHSGPANASTAEFLGNNQLLVGYDDGSLRRVDLVTRRPVGSAMRVLPSGVAEARVTPDGKTLLADDFDANRIVMVDRATGRHLRDIVPRQRIADFVISPDGRYVVAGGSVNPPAQPDVYVWSLPAGKLIGTLKGDASPQTAANNDGPSTAEVAFSRIGMLAVGIEAGTITLFDGHTFAEIGKLRGVAKVVGVILQFSPDGTRLLSGEPQQTRLMLWNVPERRPAWPAPVQGEGGVAQFTPTGDILLSSNTGRITTLDGATGQPTGDTLNLQGGSACALAISPDRRTFAVPDCNSPTVALFSLDGRATIGHVISRGEQLGSYSPDGRLLWTATDRAITIRDARTLEARYHLPGSMLAIAFTPDSKYVIVVDHNGRVGRYDYRTNRFTGTAGHIRANAPSALAVDPTSGHVALGYDDGSVIVVDENGRQLEPTTITADPVRSQIHGLSFSPDGRRLAVAAQDEDTVLYDTRTGRQLGARIPKAANARFSPDGKLLVVAAFNGTLAFYDATTLRPSGSPITASQAWVGDLTFSHDGQLLATVALDGTARLFDVEARDQIGSPLVSSRFGPAALRPDGGELATQVDLPSSIPGLVHSLTRVWTLDPTAWQRAACYEAGRNLTHAEWAKYIGGPYRRTCPEWPNGQPT
jgi:class 3 adenylate cyclase/WD40 repeat protein